MGSAAGTSGLSGCPCGELAAGETSSWFFEKKRYRAVFPEPYRQSQKNIQTIANKTVTNPIPHSSPLAQPASTTNNQNMPPVVKSGAMRGCQFQRTHGTGRN